MMGKRLKTGGKRGIIGERKKGGKGEKKIGIKRGKEKRGKGKRKQMWGRK